MLALELLRWWYSDGWLKLRRGFEFRLSQIYQMFSVPILLNTLFVPWKRITTNRGRGPGELLRALLDNAVSRLVGFGARVIVIITALACLLLLSLLALVSLIVWPFMPLAAVVLILQGLLNG